MVIGDGATQEHFALVLAIYPQTYHIYDRIYNMFGDILYAFGNMVNDSLGIIIYWTPCRYLVKFH